jgi:hypothetical protein
MKESVASRCAVWADAPMLSSKLIYQSLNGERSIALGAVIHETIRSSILCHGLPDQAHRVPSHVRQLPKILLYGSAG